jgi:hypothetical protein
MQDRYSAPSQRPQAWLTPPRMQACATVRNVILPTIAAAFETYRELDVPEVLELYATALERDLEREYREDRWQLIEEIRTRLREGQSGKWRHPMMPSPPDRAVVVADSIVRIIFASPRNLSAQLEALLRGEFADIARQARDETRLTGE